MSGVNKVIIVGRLGTDPELKTVGSGQQVARLSVATSENWVDREGQKQERTEWHRIVVWGKLAEICGRHLAKGRQVYLEGRLQTRSWEDQQGQKKYATEIIANNIQFLGAPGEQRDNSNSQATTTKGGDDFGFQDFAPEPSFDSSEEIPF
jgi:single-strand DNA-binding protein